MRPIMLGFVEFSCSACEEKGHGAPKNEGLGKTFSIKAATPASNPFAQERIEQAIIANLTAKGRTLVDGDADLALFTHVKVSVQKALDLNSLGYGGYYGWGGWDEDFGATRVNVLDIPVGTLMVDAVDRISKEMVWRGIAQGTIPASSTPEKSKKRINKAVAKLLKNFPPETRAPEK